MWHIFQVWWVLGHVQAVKNAIIWDNKVVIRKTIGTWQVETWSGPKYMQEAHLLLHVFKPVFHHCPSKHISEEVWHASGWEAGEERRNRGREKTDWSGMSHIFAVLVQFCTQLEACIQGPWSTEDNTLQRVSGLRVVLHVCSGVGAGGTLLGYSRMLWLQLGFEDKFITWTLPRTLLLGLSSRQFQTVWGFKMNQILATVLVLDTCTKYTILQSDMVTDTPDYLFVQIIHSWQLK